MQARVTLGIYGAVAVTLWPARTVACPYCDSEIGQQVSAGIFNEEFWSNAILTLLPLLVMLLLVALIHFGVPWPKRSAVRGPSANKETTPRIFPTRKGIPWINTTDVR